MQASSQDVSATPQHDMTAAEIKKQIVRENIYGVDIEKGAVDIARLRFWLAIIVDEKEPIPLPNLDYKIMQGNSLLENFEGEDLSSLTTTNGTLFDSEEIIKQLTSAINGFYIPSDHIAKAKIRRHIAEKVFQLLKERQLPPEKLAKLEKLDLHANSEFFLWHTWFGDVFNRPNACNGTGGFDIVIGNPPYFVLKNDVRFKSEYENNYPELKSGRMNIYQVFFGLAERITGRHGVVAFIHPKTLLSDSYLSATRNYLLEHFNGITILNIVNRHDVFDNVLQAVIVSLWKKTENKNYRVAEIQSKKDLSETKYIMPTFEQFVDGEHKFIVSGNKIVYAILKKVSEMKTERFNFKTGSYEWNKYKQFLSGKQQKNSGRLVYGENIQRFAFEESKKRIETTFITGANVNYLATPAIITQRTTSSEQEWRIFATLINPSDFNCKVCTENHTNVFTVTNLDTAKYYLGILNSKFMDFYFRIFNSNTQVSSGELNALPVPAIPEKQQKPVIALVDKILAAKKANQQADTSDLEKQIDDLAYDLYGLTKDEKDIIKGR